MKRKHLISALVLISIWALILASTAYGFWNAIQHYSPESLAEDQAIADAEWEARQKVIDAKSANFPIGHQVKALRPSTHPLAIKMRHSIRYFLHGMIDFSLPEIWSTKVKSNIENIIGIPLITMMFLMTLIFNTLIPIIGTILFLATFRKEYKIQYREQLLSRYEEVMMEYLFGELPAKEVALEMRKVTSKLGKDILIESLMNYERNLSGEYADRIILLYRLVGLHHFSMRKIKSRQTTRRVSGIRELSNLYPSGALKVIIKYLNDKNHLVRSEALISYAFLDTSASYSFLDNLNSEFSTWTQLNILNYVKLHEQAVPSFQKWLQSSNNDVQDFCIKMIQYFQQIESAQELTAMIYHPNRYTRENIYQAIRALNYVDAKTVLIGRYFDEVARNKIEILKTIREIGSIDDIDFFLLALSDENSVEIILLICSIIIDLAPSGEYQLRNFAEERDKNLFKYINYITKNKA
ncbi:MAG: HEAT repeat domain-containing protein [Mangrovibacterium sp.]